MSETKIVEFEGQQYKVPAEAKYMARDDDGEVYWYAVKPTKKDCFWHATGRYNLAESVEPLCDWQDSLTKI